MKSYLWKALDALGWIWCIPQEPDKNPELAKFLKDKIPIFWVMGAKYCGKTTLAKELSKITKYRLLRCSQLINECLAQGDFVTHTMKYLIEKYGVVSDEIIINLLLTNILNTFESEKAKGYIIDGFPLDNRQAKEFISAICKPKIIIYLCLLDKHIVKRVPKDINMTDEEIIKSNSETMKKLNEVYRNNERKTLKIVANKPPNILCKQLVQYLNTHYGYSFSLSRYE